MTNSCNHPGQKQFGAQATGYVAGATLAEWHWGQRLIDLIKPQPNWYVLDIAADAGYAAHALARHVSRVIAVDLTHPTFPIAHDHIPLSQLAPPQTAFCKANAQSLPFPSATFACITCRLVAHRFTDIAAFTQEAARILKPGGTLAVVDNVVTGDSKTAQFVNTFENLRDPSHNWAYTPDDWSTFFVSAGLTVIFQEAFLKQLDFDMWAAQKGVSGKSLTRLRVLLAHSPDYARRWLKPMQVGGRLTFQMTEFIIIGTTPGQ